VTLARSRRDNVVRRPRSRHHVNHSATKGSRCRSKSACRKMHALCIHNQCILPYQGHCRAANSKGVVFRRVLPVGFAAPVSGGHTMTVKIVPNDRGNPPGKLADAEGMPAMPWRLAPIAATAELRRGQRLPSLLLSGKYNIGS
jgi:hypothetical protein